MGPLLRVLIVENSEDDTRLLLRELQRGEMELQWERIDSTAAMVAALDRQSWDLVIADFTMPGFSGTEALAALRVRDPDLPFIFVSGAIGEDVAVEAMKTGAHDFIMKGNLRRLLPAVTRELREAELRREHRRMAERLKHLAYYDALTDLPNRALLHDRLHQGLAAAQRNHKPLAFLILDLDGFKEINDTLGHRVGDAFLQRVGQRMREELQEPDTVARLGGDEFAVILPEADLHSALAVAGRLAAVVERPFREEPLHLTVRASIGIALYPLHGLTEDVLMQRADVAMYMAKETKRGVAVYASETDRYNQPRLLFKSELRQAIESGQLVQHYQPKVSLHSQKVLGLEALTYWQHPRDGLLPPARFIGLAEQNDLIRPLTLAAIDVALRSCRRWRADDPELTLSVNLSPHALQDDRFPEEVALLVKASTLALPSLELEITENLIIADPARALAMLTQWNRIGIRLSIDDFGTGYSSLVYLKKLPVHELKIDRSFIADLADHGNDVIVRSVIELAHGLGLTVVAEGVETQAMWDRLAALGCDAAQGFYLSRPAPFAEMTSWLLRWRESTGLDGE